MKEKTLEKWEKSMASYSHQDQKKCRRACAVKVKEEFCSFIIKEEGKII